MTAEQALERAKDKHSGFRLMGFGHRVYRNFDPRAVILKRAADRRPGAARRGGPAPGHRPASRGAARWSDRYFVERKLYPNVDFYSGILLRAMGIPTSMFTVMFAIGRMPGWIAHWREQHGERRRPHRPAQAGLHRAPGDGLRAHRAAAEPPRSSGRRAASTVNGDALR